MSNLNAREIELLAQLKQLSSERRNPNSQHLDELSTIELVACINAEDSLVSQAVANALEEIAQLIDNVARAFDQGGRLIYVGAGTSGRLGVLDAVECPPTFSVGHDRVIGLIAGGLGAIHQAVEGAEDDPRQGQQDLKNIDLSARDVVVGIAASGRTPYVMGALKYAQSIGAGTGAISCNLNAPIFANADVAITALVGPEVLTGSTRMKSGTAQKMILNMLSTGAMIKTGKVYKNLMVDVKASNEKLYVRAINIVCEATGAEQSEAKAALEACDYQAKVAILMLLSGDDALTAEQKLTSVKGKLREALRE